MDSRDSMTLLDDVCLYLFFILGFNYKWKICIFS